MGAKWAYDSAWRGALENPLTRENALMAKMKNEENRLIFFRTKIIQKLPQNFFKILFCEGAEAFIIIFLELNFWVIPGNFCSKTL